jgi:putative SOS response-associated peptidase YedK
VGYGLETTPETDNLPPRGDVYPDQDAPVLRPAAGGECLELANLRWGFPPIAKGKAPITNIRNLKSRWWRDMNRPYLLETEYRCLVPFTAFAEPVRDPTWFNVPGKEVAFFAGIWRPWSGERLAPVPGKRRRARQQGDWSLFAFLTTEANSVVRPVHEKAMPVILHDPAECREWLSGGAKSLHLQRPLPDRELQVVDDVAVYHSE